MKRAEMVANLKQEQAANKLYQEAKKMLHKAWELAIAKADDKYNKEVEAKFYEVKNKLAEADALVPSNSEYKKWSVVERFLASSVAEDDPYCDVKRFEIKKWFEYYTGFLNKRITYPSDYTVEVIYKILSYNECWSGSELNRAAVAKKLIISKRWDGEPLEDSLKRYHIACQFCLESDINGILDSRKEIGTIERFIHLAISSNKLSAFWCYYTNIVNVETPNPDLVNKFKQLAGDINDKQVLYKYGIDSAVAVGSKEAVEFFWKKLPNKDPKILFEAAIKTPNNYGPDDSYIVAFCIDQLDSYEQPELFRKLMREDFIKSAHGRSHVMIRLREGFYEHLEKVIKYLKPSDFPREEYEMLTWRTCKNIVSGPKALFDQAVQFLSWLWDLPGFESHRQHFQDSVETTSSALGDLINIGVLEPVHKILDSMDTLHTKLFTLTCSEGGNVCYSLYIQNEKELLQKLLGSIKTTIKKSTNKFLEKSDQEVLEKLESVLTKQAAKSDNQEQKNINISGDDVSVSLQAFNFYKQYDRQSLEKLLYNAFGDTKGEKLLQKIDQAMLGKLNNMISNTQKSYKESLFYNSSDSDHHDNPQDDSSDLSDSSVLVMGEGDNSEFTSS